MARFVVNKKVRKKRENSPWALNKDKVKPYIEAMVLRNGGITSAQCTRINKRIWKKNNIEEKLLTTIPSQVFYGGLAKKSDRKTSMEMWGYEFADIPIEINKEELGVNPITHRWWYNKNEIRMK